MMNTVDPIVGFKEGFELPNTDTFHFEDHRLMLFWVPELAYMRKYYKLEDNHNISININARDHTSHYSETMFYSIYWAKDMIVERIQFIDDNNKLHNRAGPCKIINTISYGDISVYRSTTHKTSKFENHAFVMEYALHGKTIDEERANYLSSISDSFPWTADRPIQDKEYAMFLLKYANGN